MAGKRQGWRNGRGSAGRGAPTENRKQEAGFGDEGVGQAVLVRRRKAASAPIPLSISQTPAGRGTTVTPPKKALSEQVPQVSDNRHKDTRVRRTASDPGSSPGKIDVAQDRVEVDAHDRELRTSESGVWASVMRRRRKYEAVHVGLGCGQPCGDREVTATTATARLDDVERKFRDADVAVRDQGFQRLRICGESTPRRRRRRS